MKPLLPSLPRIDGARVLCLFDYQATTGFSTVSTNIVLELKARFGPKLRLDIVPINYFGKEKEIWEDEYTRIIPMAKGEVEADAFGRYTFLRTLNWGEYDGYFIIQDLGVAIGMLPNLVEIRDNYLKKGWQRPQGLFYFPVDSAPLPLFFPEKGPSLHFFDQLVTYTHYGKTEILTKDIQLDSKLTVIEHGSNSEDFYAMLPEERRLFRHMYFGRNADKTIIINVNRNQYRKDIATSMLAIDKFILCHPEYAGKMYLYLHMHPHDVMGWDIPLIGDQLGWTQGVDYGFPPETEQHHGASKDTLRGIYNAADLYLTTTTGEGWGLTVTEAMMCRCPVMAPFHTSLIEMAGWNQGRLWPLFRLHDYIACDDSVRRWQCDPFEVAEQLFVALSEPELRAIKVERALEYVTGLSWKTVCDKWEAIFRKLFF